LDWICIAHFQLHLTCLAQFKLDAEPVWLFLVYVNMVADVWKAHPKSVFGLPFGQICCWSDKT